ncbi:unnamed protein product [Discosporangium mesarthrocarpum]
MAGHCPVFSTLVRRNTPESLILSCLAACWGRYAGQSYVASSPHGESRRAVGQQCPSYYFMRLGQVYVFQPDAWQTCRIFCVGKSSTPWVDGVKGKLSEGGGGRGRPFPSPYRMPYHRRVPGGPCNNGYVKAPQSMAKQKAADQQCAL